MKCIEDRFLAISCATRAISKEVKMPGITIDGEKNEVDELSICEDGYLTRLTLEDRCEYYVAEDGKQAGEAARQYWVDMANDDPAEFRCIVGDESLVKWALGQWAGPGTTKVNSLDEWLDLFLDCPEEEWAHYDGEECECEADAELIDLLGFAPTVAYRIS